MLFVFVYTVGPKGTVARAGGVILLFVQSLSKIPYFLHVKSHTASSVFDIALVFSSWLLLAPCRSVLHLENMTPESFEKCACLL